MVHIAGIGSRDLTSDQIEICQKLGRWIVQCGHILHTGNARGADQAFAAGANQVAPERVHLHLPWPSYENEAIVRGNQVDILSDRPEAQQQEYFRLAREHHPAWDHLSSGVKKLHARNGLIIAEAVLVLAWPGPKLGGGGTGQGMRMARSMKIPVVDLSAIMVSSNPRELLHKLCEDIQGLESRTE